MSTLPFLLSVADELDNINSQSYMDDFGLGFHPHRQYYRSPTIQLSLPASTDWMQEQRQRCRTHKFVDETPNQNLCENDAEAEEDEYAADVKAGNGGNFGSAAGGGGERYDRNGASTSAAGGSRQKYTSALNSNTDEDNVDNSVQMYNLSKKCCKNYHRQAGAKGAEEDAPAVPPAKQKSTAEGSSGGGGGYKLHTKCMEGNHSSSDESLQKVSSSIEFLTCFLLKKSRASKNSNSMASSGGGSGKKS